MTTMQRMTANDLAREFHGRGLAGTWLSRKRTDYLRSLSMQNRRDVLFDPARHTYSSQWEVDADRYSWTLYISPINGCGLFNVKTYTRADFERDQAEAAYKRACGELNERVFTLMQEGDLDGARQAMVEFHDAQTDGHSNA